MATKSKAFSTTSSNFGAKGWVIMILTFFSILLMSNICYDSLNVTIPEFGTTFAVLAGVPGAEMEGAIGGNIAMLYMFSLSPPGYPLLVRACGALCAVN